MSDINWGVKEWSRSAGVRYYERDLSYKPDSILAYPTDTVTISGADPYSLVFAGSSGTILAKHLLGAVIEQTSEDNNSVQSVTTLTARMKRNVLFANGTVTVKQRSVLHDTTTQKFYAPFRTGAYIIVNDSYTKPVTYLEEGEFWRLPEVFDPTDTEPCYYTCLKCTETGVPYRIVMDSVWPITPYYTFCARIKTIPTDVTAGTDNVDVPDGIYQSLLNYLVCKYKADKGYIGGAEQYYMALKSLRDDRSY